MQSKADIKGRAIGALRALFIADSLSMPVHWYYDTQEIDKAFPEGINKFYAPPSYHPTTIMGNPLKEDTIVGSVILTTPGKKEQYGIANNHYHAGLQAGENTLNAYCARVLLKTYAEHKRYDLNSFVNNYINLMKTDAHPDIYAEGYHHKFFRNLEAGAEPHKCGEETGGTSSAGGLVTVGPLAVLELLKGHSIQEV